MSDARDADNRPDPNQANDGGSASDAVPLPKPVQEHLGRELRTTYHTEAEKPAFLGDIGVPPEFEPYIQKIEAQERRRERAHQRGVEAVRTALQDMQINAALSKALDKK